MWAWYNVEDKKLRKRVSVLELDFRIVKMVNDHVIHKVWARGGVELLVGATFEKV